MNLKKDMVVHIKSENDLLKPYWEAKTNFIVDSVSIIEDDVYVTVKFEKSNKNLEVVVMGYEIVPAVKVVA